jgi:hypothetical protein
VLQKVRRPLLQFPTGAKNHLLGAHDQVEKVLERKSSFQLHFQHAENFKLNSTADTTPDTVNNTRPVESHIPIKHQNPGTGRLWLQENTEWREPSFSFIAFQRTFMCFNQISRSDLAVRLDARRAKNMSARQRVLRALKKTAEADGVRV